MSRMFRWSSCVISALRRRQSVCSERQVNANVFMRINPILDTLFSTFLGVNFHVDVYLAYCKFFF